MVAQVEYSVASREVGWRRVRSAPDTWRLGAWVFLVEPQNQSRRFVDDLTSKPIGRFSSVWPQNRWRWFSTV
jgi:hypothetical protein